MIVGWIVGLAIGAIAQRTIDEHIEQYKQQNPIPGENGSPEAGRRHAATEAA